MNRDGLTIRAERATESKEEEKFLRRGRAYSAFERSASFPEEVDPSDAEGRMRGGILELKLSKKAPKPEMMARKIELKQGVFSDLSLFRRLRARHGP